MEDFTKRHSCSRSLAAEEQKNGKGKTLSCRQTEPPRGLPALGTTESMMCTKTAAKRLGVSHQTLEKWRSQNRGPRFYKIGGKTVRYRKSDLDAFITEAA